MARRVPAAVTLCDFFTLYSSICSARTCIILARQVAAAAAMEGHPRWPPTSHVCFALQGKLLASSSRFTKFMDVLVSSFCGALPQLLQGKLLASDSFPGQDRTKLCMASKVRTVFAVEKSRAFFHCYVANTAFFYLVGMLCHGLISQTGSPLACMQTARGRGSVRHMRQACPLTGIAFPTSLQVPLGVVLAIPPFNYPLNLAVS